MKYKQERIKPFLQFKIVPNSIEYFIYAQCIKVYKVLHHQIVNNLNQYFTFLTFQIPNINGNFIYGHISDMNKIQFIRMY